ncbi:toll/interleukin-1 receptor domain-containing protein [Actinomadura sp. NAK00032]|uniref:toll/interleukin-1 receptor domain-containing protein n=1 Tax=Actinomadura sp. NAK00032 TaxID=2742128 RepID=UPI00158FD48C|nr:toll/interleukin-1 receptor domain-containing protein [Actinomadura sp. NAK00032]QKW34824.1 toll/interleukin-1 receptor domain-containing protein [Actinomadura sp. NAK00032]
MGFHAVSAEDVYDYVFRTDGRSRRLTDGFGWSIMLVGDDSPVCAEFLQEYCVDLCRRTANRVRFVFFSGLSEGEFTRIQYREAQRGTILGGVLARMRRGIPFPFSGPVFDHERPDWSTIRPQSLRPLRDRDDIEVHLDFQRQARTAIPGTEAALHFAQRLGIGRHVPCLVMFTDIGELKVDVFPFAGHDAAEVHARVRGWVDEYYEVNRDALRHWDGVEDQVLRLATASSGSLLAVQGWAPARRRTQQCLRTLAVLAHELSGSGPVDLSRAASDPNVPWTLRDTLRAVGRRLAELDARLAAYQALNRAVSGLRNTTDPAEVDRLLAELLEHALPQETSSLARRARNRLTGPEQDLFDWWRKAPIRLSKSRFRALRKAWRRLVVVGREDSALSLRSDHETLWASVGRLALAPPATCDVDRVLSELAGHYGVDAGAASWREATTGFRAALRKMIAETVRTAPGWVRDGSTGLTLAQCVPPPGPGDAASLLAFLHGVPELEHLVRLRRESEGLGGSAVAAMLESLAAGLEREALALSTAAADGEAARAALAEVVDQRRAELEREEREAAEDPGLRPRLPACDPALVAGLHDALDAYDTAVAQIVYPHLRDPDVFSVRTSTDLLAAAGLHAQRVSRPDADPLRSTLRRAVANDREAARRWPAERVAGAAVRPSRALGDALEEVLGPERLAGVLEAHEGRTAETFDRLVADGGAEALLASLTMAELGALLTRTLPDGPGAPADPSRQALHGLVLASLGLRPRHGAPVPDPAEAARTLHGKLLRDEFDVFVAHSSADRPAVRELCRELRRRGVQPWLDIHEIRPGTSVQDKIQLAVRKARSALICLGPDGIGPWQETEIRALMEQCVERSMPLIPVMLPGARAVPARFGFLGQFGTVSFDQDITEQEPLCRLVWGITGVHPAGGSAPSS